MQQITAWLKEAGDKLERQIESKPTDLLGKAPKPVDYFQIISLVDLLQGHPWVRENFFIQDREKVTNTLWDTVGDKSKITDKQRAYIHALFYAKKRDYVKIEQILRGVGLVKKPRQIPFVGQSPAPAKQVTFPGGHAGHLTCGDRACVL